MSLISVSRTLVLPHIGGRERNYIWGKEDDGTTGKNILRRTSMPFPGFSPISFTWWPWYLLFDEPEIFVIILTRQLHCTEHRCLICLTEITCSLAQHLRKSGMWEHTDPWYLLKATNSSPTNSWREFGQAFQSVNPSHVYILTSFQAKHSKSSDWFFHISCVIARSHVVKPVVTTPKDCWVTWRESKKWILLDKPSHWWLCH